VRLACARGKREGLKSIRECGFSYDPDMLTLVITRGRDFPLALLVDRVRCPWCQSRRMRLMYQPSEDRAQAAQAAARMSTAGKMIE
jgi:hypothetical protein